ncbi:MAG: DUF881 domain-containing protein, partial [Vulcanimicrobiota bacterium]
MNEQKLEQFSQELMPGETSTGVDWFDARNSNDGHYGPGKSYKPQLKNSIKEKEAENTWRWSIAVACLILGIFVALLFKTYRKEGEVHTLYGQRKDLAEMVKYLQTERNKLQADLKRTRSSLSELEESVSQGKNQFATMNKQLLLARQEAGLIPVRGPGIVIKLNDSNRKPRDSDDPNYYIVHDIDLMALVNELWASGAEAISINEQRVVMTSAIRCVGPSITVNTTRLTPPYIIKAIGPSTNLETG